MQLDPREASLVEVFRRLPPDTAAELSALAERLATLSPHHRIDWSDSWTDEDRTRPVNPCRCQPRATPVSRAYAETGVQLAGNS